jgi:hypothetical protein
LVNLHRIPVKNFGDVKVKLGFDRAEGAGFLAADPGSKRTNQTCCLAGRASAKAIVGGRESRRASSSAASCWNNA